jgi:hypothetical protein
VIGTARYVRFVGLLAIVIVVLITINTLLSTPASQRGVRAGRPMPPFALPLAASTVTGDPDVATHANEGSAGRVPACQERGPGILNICQIYDRGPLALAFVVAPSSCTRVLGELQAALPAFPGLQVAAVALRGSRAAAARLAASLRFPVGYDREGATLVNLYHVVVCPQVTLAYPGGVVEGRALLNTPTPRQLEGRLRALYSASIARGWKPPTSAAR